MKKQLLAFCMVFFLLLAGCNHKKSEIQLPSNFYYLNRNISYNSTSGVICPEVRETADIRNDLTMFIKRYLEGPNSAGLEAVIPSDTRLVTCAMINDTVTLTFSEEFAKLSGTRLSIASSALLLSVNSFNGAERIHICAENSLLDEKEDIILTLDDIVLIDSIVQDTV